MGEWVARPGCKILVLPLLQTKLSHQSTCGQFDIGCSTCTILSFTQFVIAEIDCDSPPVHFRSMPNVLTNDGPLRTSG